MMITCIRCKKPTPGPKGYQEVLRRRSRGGPEGWNGSSRGRSRKEFGPAERARMMRTDPEVQRLEGAVGSPDLTRRMGSSACIFETPA